MEKKFIRFFSINIFVMLMLYHYYAYVCMFMCVVCVCACLYTNSVDTIIMLIVIFLEIN